MKLYFSFLCTLLLSLSLSAQNILLFPETTAYTSGDLPVNMCLIHSARLIKSVSVEDTASINDLRNIGRQLMRLGYHQFAEEAFDKLYEIHANAYPENDPRYIKAYHDLARSYLFLIRYDETLNMYTELKELTKEVYGRNSYEYLLLLSEELEARFFTRNVLAANQLAEEALEIIPQLNMNNTLYHGIVLNGKAAASLDLEGPQQAISYYNQALSILKNKKHPVQYQLGVAANIAGAYAQLGKISEATKWLDEYYPVAQRELTQQVTSIARVWEEYGHSFTAIRDFARAEQSFARSYMSNSLMVSQVTDFGAEMNDLFFKNHFLATCAHSGASRGVLLMLKEKYNATRDFRALKDAYEVVQVFKKYKKQLQQSNASDRNRLLLFQLAASEILDVGRYVCYQLYQKTGNSQYLKEAFNMSEIGKSTLLVYALRSEKSQQFAKLPKEVIAREKAFDRQAKQLERNILEALNEAEKTQFTVQLNALNRENVRFKDSIARAYPEYYKHYSEGGATVEEIQHIIPPGKALIEYALGEKIQLVFIITRTEFNVLELFTDNEVLRSNTALLRKCLNDYEYIKREEEQAKKAYIRTASYFYNEYLSKALSSLKSPVGELIIIPDKELGHLPFEVFLTKATPLEASYEEMSYLLRDYIVTYSFSATQLKEKMLQDMNKGRTEKDGVLAFAGRYGDEEQLAVADELKRRSSLRSLRKALSPLPGAEAEVALMNQYLFGEFFNGTSASEALFKERVSQYNIIHLAMHGLLDSEHPVLSSLAFSEDGNPNEDNFLHSYEITELDINADLVVLSACETGYGKFSQGEGVMSLAYSFMYAGASSVLVSLWQVNDKVTSEIMKQYYLALGLGYTKSEALQMAKTKYLSEAKGFAAHPAFWGAFVQLGDPSPVELLCKTGLTFRTKLMLMGGTALLLIAAVFGFWRWRARRRRAA